MDDSTEDDEFYSDYLGNRKAKKCNHSNMKCTTQTNDQWRTPPYWRGNFFCPFVSVTPVVILLFIQQFLKLFMLGNFVCFFVAC